MFCEIFILLHKHCDINLWAIASVRILKHKFFLSLKVIAAAVGSDPEKYIEAFLGKPNEEYCAWILDSDKWGGKLSFLNYIIRYWQSSLLVVCCGPTCI